MPQHCLRSGRTGGRSMAQWLRLTLLGCCLTSVIRAAGTSSSQLAAGQQQQPSWEPHERAPAAAAAAVLQPSSSSGRRSLKQINFDPYGLGYYDPYQAGVTPGLVNVDINRETGLHVDVGTVAVDVSADKNYYGLGIGQLVGVGAAKDRGWNLQIAGGNVADVSVTKDAGLGLWLLNGLLNVNIGPDGRGWENNIAARSVPGAQAAPSGVAAAAQPSSEVTAVVVDDPAAGSSGSSGSSSSSSGSGSGGSGFSAANLPSSHALAAPEAAVVQEEEPVITEEPIVLPLDVDSSNSAEAESGPEVAVGSGMRSSAAAAAAAAARQRTPSYMLPRPAAATAAAGARAGAGPYQQAWQAPAAVGYNHAAAAARQPQHAAATGFVAQPGQPVAAVAPAAAVTPAAAAAAPAAAVTPAAAAAAAPAAGRRLPCEGGVAVAVNGNKVRCRYKRERGQQQQVGWESAGP